ncbi:MAG: Fe-S cluster assembly protein SufD [Bacteroidetes bacterium]|nr:Fe-S cluster assembly protein SufD [Bacteroidota bacterium]MBS1559576.1 Fe-S cluster assembly protein SufD [Bacteroidota bacterium]
MSTTTTLYLNGKIANLFEQSGITNQQRKEAFAAFQKIGLPANKSEEYRFTPITRVLEKNFDFNSIGNSSSINSIEPFFIPNVDANLIVFINGIFSSTFSKIISKELEIKSLQSAIDSGEAIPYFQKYLLNSADAFTALNSTLWSDGIFIHVPTKTKVEKPVFILHVNEAGQNQSISHTRLLAVLEEESELTLIEKSVSNGTNNIFHTFAEEIVVKENASFDYIKIQNDEGKLHQVANTLIHQSNRSKLNTFTLTLNGSLIRNNFNIAIDGEHCESHFYGLYLLNGNTLADNHTVVDHIKPNSHSNELYKGVMDGNSKGVFNGKIYVRPQAQKTNAFQSNRNILLTDSSSINTKPQLEIWADDVKCSHGCTSGQLDEEAMFYLRSRGIPQQQAKAMLLYAFALETLEPIKNTELKKHLESLISQRLNQLQ